MRLKILRSVNFVVCASAVAERIGGVIRNVRALVDVMAANAVDAPGFATMVAHVLVGCQRCARRLSGAGSVGEALYRTKEWLAQAEHTEIFAPEP